jgi:hypothetical protein
MVPQVREGFGIFFCQGKAELFWCVVRTESILAFAKDQVRGLKAHGMTINNREATQ